MSDIHFAGSDFILEAPDVSADLLTDLLDCGAPGPADGAVAYVLQTYDITGDPDDCRAYLRGYGAWDEDELSDHDENLARLVWLTGCGLNESDPDGHAPCAYFSAY